MRLFLLLSFFSAAIMLTACGDGGKNTPTPAPNNKGASLKFVASNPDVVARGAVRQLKDASPVDFQMGDLNKTSTYLFILQNSGTEAAENVQLTCDNPAVVMVPTVINILSPVSQGGVQPVIQVTVQHGYSANGIGQAPTLAPGPLTFSISATSASTSASAVLGITVRVTDFVLTTGYDAIPDGVVLSEENLNGMLNVKTDTNGFVDVMQWQTGSAVFWDPNAIPDASLAGGKLNISNTGNTDITVDLYDFPLPGDQIIYTKLSTVVIPAGTSVDIEAIVKFYHTDITYEFREIFLKIHGTGAVFDQGNFQPDQNGALWIDINEQSFVFAG